MALTDDVSVEREGIIDAGSPAQLTEAELGVLLPQGVGQGDLPDTLSERLQLMQSWLRDFEPAKNSGNNPFSVLENGEVQAHFLVQTLEAGEAEGLCEIYQAAVDLYSGDGANGSTVTLSGWVMSDAGVFVDPGWPDVQCER